MNAGAADSFLDGRVTEAATKSSEATRSVIADGSDCAKRTFTHAFRAVRGRLLRGADALRSRRFVYLLVLPARPRGGAASALFSESGGRAHRRFERGRVHPGARARKAGEARRPRVLCGRGPLLPTAQVVPGARRILPSLFRHAYLRPASVCGARGPDPRHGAAARRRHQGGHVHCRTRCEVDQAHLAPRQGPRDDYALARASVGRRTDGAATVRQVMGQRAAAG